MPSMLRLSSIAVVLLLASAPSARPQTPSYAALITDLAGTVQISHGEPDAFEPAIWGMQLYPGDRVKTLDNSRVSILLSNNTLIELGSRGNLTISSGQRLSSSRHVEGDVYGTLTRLTAREPASDVGALAGLRSAYSAEGVEAVSPRNTSITTTRPTFVWRAAESFDAYTVRLFDGGGVVWSRETSETRLEYPDDESPLELSRSYFWRVEGERMLDVVASEMVTFDVLSEDRLQAIRAREEALSRMMDGQKEGSGYHFLLGSHYVEAGLLDSAIASFSAVADVHPNAPLAHEILGKLYREIGLKDEALVQLEKALELSRRN